MPKCFSKTTMPKFHLDLSLAVLKNFAIFTKNTCVGVSFWKKKPILKKSVNGCLVHIMSLKTLKFDQDVTEMFISEFKNKESLCNVMSKIYKKHKVSKNCLNYLRWVVINSNFSYYLFFSFFVRKDSTSLILKEFHICDLTTFTRDIFRT